jgi:hypothetical protein
MSLFRLAYVSTSMLANDPREREQIADILLTARTRNAEAKITGALLATDKNFAQVLEGERAAVQATYDRIARDPRHVGIVPVLMQPIEARQFPEWSMAYIGPSQSAEVAVARVTSGLPGSEAGEAAGDLVKFMSLMLADPKVKSSLPRVR